MQTATILRRIEMLPALSRAGKRINGLHRLMRSSDLYELAYNKVSRNKGAMTPGIDGETFDGMSLEKLADLARRVAEGRYRPGQCDGSISQRAMVNCARWEYRRWKIALFRRWSGSF